MQIYLVTVASILAVIGNIPYIRDCLKGKIQPHPFTWFVWSIVSLTTFFGALQKGGGLGTIPILVSEVFTILIFLISLKYGFKHVRKLDIIFLIVCLLGLIPWYLTKDPTISVITVVIIDLIAFIPTLRKTYSNPMSENYILYLMNFCRHVLILFSLEAYNVATTLHSIVMIISNFIMTCIILVGQRKKERI